MIGTTELSEETCLRRQAGTASLIALIFLCILSLDQAKESMVNKKKERILKENSITKIVRSKERWQTKNSLRSLYVFSLKKSKGDMSSFIYARRTRLQINIVNKNTSVIYSTELTVEKVYLASYRCKT